MKTKTNQDILEIWKARFEDDTTLGGYYDEIIEMLEQALKAKDEQARREKIELVDDLLWRVKDIGEDLQNPHVWDLDEWSTPVKNLKFIEVKLNKLKNDN